MVISRNPPKNLNQLSSVYRSSTDRCTVRNVLPKNLAVASGTPRVVILNHGDLRLQIMYEYDDSSVSGCRGREESYLTVSRDVY